MLNEAEASVWRASPGFGERPVVPYAARRRRSLKMPESGEKKLSSLIAHEPPIFGSTKLGACAPNDELRSTRTPTWRKRLFWLPTCSCVR